MVICGSFKKVSTVSLSAGLKPAFISCSKVGLGTSSARLDCTIGITCSDGAGCIICDSSVKLGASSRVVTSGGHSYRHFLLSILAFLYKPLHMKILSLHIVELSRQLLQSHSDVYVSVQQLHNFIVNINHKPVVPPYLY